MLPLVSPPSLPTKATIQTSLYIQNETLPPNKLESIPLTSTPSTNSSEKKWHTRKSNTKDLLMLDELQHWTSKSVTVYSSKQNIRSTRPSKKLSEKNLGPYKIIAQAGTVSFTLRLLDMMKSVHPVFHVSQLEPSIPNSIPNCVQSPPPLIKVDREPEYEISNILDSKIDQRRCNCKLLYLVCWSGYEGTDEETSWLLATKLDHTSELITDFHVRYPDKPGPHSRP